MPRKKIEKKVDIRTRFSKDFYSDIEFPNMLYAALIRSPKNSGLLVGLKYAYLPDGYYIYTAKDVSENNEIDIMGTKIPMFCNTRVMYEGEPVGIIVGPDESIVKKIKDEIHVVLHDVDEKDLIDAIPLKKELKTGLAFENYDEFEKLFENSTHCFSDFWESSIKTPSYSETEGAICSIEKGTLHVYTPTTWASNLRNVLKTTLKFESNKISLTRTKSQPYSNNGDWRNSIIVSQVGFAALKTGKPVKLTFSYEEQCKIIENIENTRIYYNIALDSDFKIIAIKVKIKTDIGATNPFTEELLNRIIIDSCSSYNIPNLHITAEAYKTRTPPTSQNIENVISQVFFCIENQINKISEHTGICPDELRLKNICLDKQDSVMPFNLQLDNPNETLNTLINSCDFRRKFVTYRIDSLNRKNAPNSLEKFSLRGIGLACAFIGSGYYGNKFLENDQKIKVTLETDKSLTIHAINSSSSIIKIWKDIASSVLDIDIKNIHVNNIFEQEDEPCLPENDYSNLGVMTQLLKKCCTTIQTKRFKNPLPITVSKSISPKKKKQWDEQSFTGLPFYSTSYASTAVELELDPCTFKCKIRGIWIVIDSGKIFLESEAINRITLEVNQTLCSLLNDSKLDCENISIKFIHSQNDAKQLHKLVINTLPAAFSSALSQAISQTLNSFPLKENELFIKGSLI